MDLCHCVFDFSLISVCHVILPEGLMVSEPKGAAKLNAVL